MSRLLASATDALTEVLGETVETAELTPELTIARPGTAGVWRRRSRGVIRRIEAHRAGEAVVVSMTHTPAIAIQYAVALAPEKPWSAASTFRVGWARRMICNFAPDGSYEIRESEPTKGAFPAVWVSP